MVPTLNYYHGRRFQRGYGLGSQFRRFFQWMIPKLKQAGAHLADSGKEGLLNVSKDVLAGRDTKEAVRDHAKRTVGAVLQKIVQDKNIVGGKYKCNRLSGSGRRKRRRRQKKNSKKTYEDIFSS